jgi:hypothetical protein
VPLKEANHKDKDKEYSGYLADTDASCYVANGLSTQPPSTLMIEVENI